MGVVVDHLGTDRRRVGPKRQAISSPTFVLDPAWQNFSEAKPRALSSAGAHHNLAAVGAGLPVWGGRVTGVRRLTGIVAPRVGEPPS